MPEKRRRKRADDGGRPAGDEAPRIRPFWSGILTFGLVSVPVQLYPAYGRSRPSLRMVDEDGTPLERRFVCPAEEKEIELDDIVRGVPVGPDRYVVIRDRELEALEPKKSKEIDLQRFVERAALNPALFQRAYFLAPSTEAAKPYRLLARIMEEMGRVGIATFVMRGREYLVAIRADGGILRAETMRFHDEVRTAEDVGLADPVQPERDVTERMLRAVEARAADELDPDELADDWTRQLRELVEAKREEGRDVVAAPEEDPAESPIEAVDIMEVLKRSLERESSRDGSEGRDGDRLGDLTREELYERARELEIGGRSRMSKDELAEAVRAAS